MGWQDAPIDAQPQAKPDWKSAPVESGKATYRRKVRKTPRQLDAEADAARRTELSKVAPSDENPFNRPRFNKTLLGQQITPEDELMGRTTAPLAPDRAPLLQPWEVRQRDRREKRGPVKVKVQSSGWFDAPKPATPADAEALRTAGARPVEYTLGADDTGDRVWTNVRKAGSRLNSGLLRTGSSLLAPLFGEHSSIVDGMQSRAASQEAYANSPVTGETTWQNVKDAKGVNQSVVKGAMFILEQGPGGAATMPLLANPYTAGLYGASLAGNIAQNRAEADGNTDATLGDVVKAAPFAAASLGMEKLGYRGIFGTTAKTIPGRVAKSSAIEGATEYGQGVTEYGGGSIGTDQGFDPLIAHDQGLAGALVGLGMGGAIRTGVELKDGLRPAPAVAAEPAAPLLLPHYTDAPLDTEVAPPPEPVNPSPPASVAPAPPAVAPQPVPTATPTGDSGDGLGQAAEPDIKPDTQPASEPAPLRPEPGDLAEGERIVRTPAGASVRTRMDVIDASQLTQAEGANQNRDRGRDTTTLQVQDIISKFDPELLHEDPSSDRGAPIIGPDGAIDSGNGRVLTLNQIYEQHPELAAKYRAMIESRGFDTTGIDRPVLVQRRMTEMSPEQRRQFVIDSNKDTKLELSPVERAQSDADSITPEMLATYAGGDLNSTANAAFVQKFNSQLTTGEMGGMVGSDRRITPAGAQRIENAVVAHAYGEPKLLERMMESSHDEIRSITGSLADVAGPWARMRAAVKDGEIDASLDITSQLVDAAARVADARKRGIKPADLLTQQDAFDPIDPVTAELIRAFHNPAMTRSASRKAVSAFLSDYIDAASSQQSTPGLFGEVEVQSPLSIAKDLLEQRDNPNGAGLALDTGKEPTNDPRRTTQGNESRDVEEDRGEEQSPRNRGKGRASNVAESRDGRGSEGVAEDRGDYAPSHSEASFTNRQSAYDSAIRAIGMDTDEFNVLPPARKVKLLADALFKLTGIRAIVSENIPLQHAIDQLLDAHQTLQGMADMLDISPKALSLGGQIKLKLIKGARFLGSFNPGTNVIQLPGRSNSFAHEWAHGLDWHLLGRLSPSDAKGLTGEIRNNGADFTPTSVQQAFVKLLNTMFFDGSGLAARIMRLEQKIQSTTSAAEKARLQAQLNRIADGSSRASEKSRYWKGAKKTADSGYWTRPTEMFARAFEAWIAYKAEIEGRGTEFIAKGDELYNAPSRPGIADVYPKDSERIAIFAAMQQMVDALNTEAILEAGSARAASGFDDTATPPMREEADRADRKARGFIARVLGPDIEAWQIARENRRIDAADNERRAADPVKLLSKANNVRSLAFSAASDGVKMVAVRWKSKAAQAIHDHFATDLGGTRHVDRVWGEAITIRENKALNPVFKILEKHGSKGWVYKKLDQGQRDTLRRLLQGETVADDTGLVELASAMRRAYNDEWYANKNAGIDLGYVADTAYLNRQTDHELVAGNPDKFVEQATKVYELVFDRDVGKDAAEIATDEDRLDTFVEIAKKYKVDGVKALRKAMRSDEADPAAIEAQVEAMFDAVRDAYAMMSAMEHKDAILHTQTFPDFTLTSTLPNSEKRRTFPPAADELLKDFYNPDPISAFVQYVSNSVQRTEWARRFGPKSEIGKKLDEQMAKEGVPESDRRYVWSLVDRMSGRHKRTGWLANPGIVTALSVLRVKGTLAMMGRAVTLSFFEPTSMGLVTGKPMQGLQAVAKTWANVLSSGSRAERMEWARAQGFIKHHMLEQIRVMDRFGTASDTPTNLDRLPSAMFRNTGLTFLTDASDAAVLDVGRRATLDEMAHRVIEGGARGKEASNLLSELGIRDPAVFAQQIVDLNGAMPSDEWLAGKEGWDYNTALIRLTRMTIQKPSPADLAPLGRNPLASYATYSITAFLQASYRHLLKRNVKRGLRMAKAHEYENLARFSAGALSSAALLFALNALSSVARENLFNHDRQEEWDEDGTWWRNNAALAASRTFSFGALDPVINASTGLKYNRDLSYLPLGAYMGNDAQNATRVAKLFYTNSRKTNTAEHNALQGLYALVIAPSIAAGANAAPGGPLTSAAGGLITSTSTSPQAAKGFASVIVGEKNKPGNRAPTALDKRLEEAFPTPPKN